MIRFQDQKLKFGHENVSIPKDKFELLLIALFKADQKQLVEYSLIDIFRSTSTVSATEAPKWYERKNTCIENIAGPNLKNIFFF